MIFFLKYFAVREKVRNFAPAFKEQRFLKHLRKSSLIDLHKQTSSTRSKSYIIYNAQTWVKYEPLILYKVKTSIIKEARSEQIQTNADLFGG